METLVIIYFLVWRRVGVGDGSYFQRVLIYLIEIVFIVNQRKNRKKRKKTKKTEETENKHSDKNLYV